jgi:hypothetical protein
MPHVEHNLKINDISIAKVNIVNFLAILIDKKLNFTPLVYFRDIELYFLGLSGFFGSFISISRET